MQLLSPDACLLVLTLGVLLVYVEFNRPGSILPGAAGLTLVLLSSARFLRLGISPLAAAACILGFATLAFSTRTRQPLVSAALATGALLYGFLALLPAASQNRPHALVGVPCALLLGVGTSLLTTIAARARQNKGLDLK